jgi:molybdopterin-binding protein
VAIRPEPFRTGRACDEWRHSVKISARNLLKGKITEVTKGHTTTHVLLDIGGGMTVVSSITNEAADELNLVKGKSASAVINASDVMIGID